jgi:SAM-dependent methyltransferase
MVLLSTVDRQLSCAEGVSAPVLHYSVVPTTGLCHRAGMTDYLSVNRANWDERAPAHAASPDYGFERFVADPAHLSHVVRFDLPRLGDVAGLRAVHLQCHIGTDTLSLHRLGARITGLDFSPASLTQARDLATRAGAAVDFVESTVYEAASVLEPGTFDLVYTGIGALCWLPDIRRWAEVVSTLLRPGGRLFLREAHPMLWALDDRVDDRLVVDFPYFETAEALVWEEDGTYVETESAFQHTTTHSWNHGIGEVVTALFDAGLDLTMLHEHDSVPWNALPGQMARDDRDEWRLIDRPWRLAHTYTLQARKRG